MCDLPRYVPSDLRARPLRVIATLAGLSLGTLAAAQVVPPQAPPAATPPTSPAGAPTAAPPSIAPGSDPGLTVPEGYRVVDSESYPDDPRIDIARRLLAGGQFAEARVVLETVLKQKPTLGRAQFFMGTTLSKLKQYEQARPYFEKSIAGGETFPERKHAHHFMGWASYNLGELERAKTEFEAHLALVGEEPDSIFALGLIAFDSDELDVAEARFQKALDLQQTPNPNKRDLAKAWARLGDVSMRRDDAAKAEERFMQSLASYPDLEEVWLKLARARDRLGKTIEADRAREEAERAKERVAQRSKRPPATPGPEQPAPAKDAPKPPDPAGSPTDPPATPKR